MSTTNFMFFLKHCAVLATKFPDESGNGIHSLRISLEKKTRTFPLNVWIFYEANWQFQGDSAVEWLTYPDEVAHRLEQSRSSNENLVIRYRATNQQMYEINLNSMTQRNIRTGNSRPIRRQALQNNVTRFFQAYPC